ncbi:MAG: hypothetical protein WC513_09455, partial [Bacteroidales bacterium]
MAKKLGKDKVTMLMPEELQDVPLWAEQLFEESLGKDGKGVTLFYGERLAPAELKPASENDRVFFRINLGKGKTQQKLWEHLTANGYPVFEMDVESVDSIGGVMLGFQRTVATIAYLWDICFVNQPAVEGYKKATRAVMSGLRQGETVQVPSDWEYISFGKLKLYLTPLYKVGALTKDELAREVARLGADMQNAAAVYAAVLNILRSKPGFEAMELTSYGRMTPGLRKILEEARFAIFTSAFKMPSKLGEGPDKNHSYQQNIEGGKNMFFSTYFMPLSIKQPEALTYDDNLLRAQTIGTINSMVENKRKAVLITAGSTTEEAEREVEALFGQVEKHLKIANRSLRAQGSDSPSVAGGDQPSVAADKLKEVWQRLRDGAIEEAAAILNRCKESGTIIDFWPIDNARENISREWVGPALCGHLQTPLTRSGAMFLDALVAKIHGLEREIGIHVPENNIEISSPGEFAVRELVTNIWKYAESGFMIVHYLYDAEGAKTGLKFICMDKGRGILDVAKAVSFGFSTSESRGLGLAYLNRKDQPYLRNFKLETVINSGTMATIEESHAAAESKQIIELLGVNRDEALKAFVSLSVAEQHVVIDAIEMVTVSCEPENKASFVDFAKEAISSLEVIREAKIASANHLADDDATDIIIGIIPEAESHQAAENIETLFREADLLREIITKLKSLIERFSPTSAAADTTDPAKSSRSLTPAERQELNSIISQNSGVLGAKIAHPAYGRQKQAVITAFRAAGYRDLAEVLEGSVVTQAPPKSALSRQLEAFSKKHDVVIYEINCQIDGTNLIAIVDPLQSIATLIAHATVARALARTSLTPDQIDDIATIAEKIVCGEPMEALEKEALEKTLALISASAVADESGVLISPEENVWIDHLWRAFRTKRGSVFKDFRSRMKKVLETANPASCWAINKVRCSYDPQYEGLLVKGVSSFFPFEGDRQHLQNMLGFDNYWRLKELLGNILENVAQHGSGRYTLACCLRILDEKTAEIKFAVLDLGQGFIGKRGIPVKITTALRHEYSAGKNGCCGVGLTNTYMGSDWMSITEIHNYKNRREGYYFERGKGLRQLTENEIEELRIQSGTKVIFVKRISGDFSGKRVTCNSNMDSLIIVKGQEEVLASNNSSAAVDDSIKLYSFPGMLFDWELYRPLWQGIAAIAKIFSNLINTFNKPLASNASRVMIPAAFAPILMGAALPEGATLPQALVPVVIIALIMGAVSGAEAHSMPNYARGKKAKTEESFRRARESGIFSRSIIRIRGDESQGSAYVVGEIGDYYILLTGTHVIWEESDSGILLLTNAGEKIGVADVAICNKKQYSHVADLAILVIRKDWVYGGELVPIRVAPLVKEGEAATLVSGHNGTISSGSLISAGKTLILSGASAARGDSGSPCLRRTNSGEYRALATIVTNYPRGMLFRPEVVKDMLACLNREKSQFKLVRLRHENVVRAFLKGLRAQKVAARSTDSSSTADGQPLTEEEKQILYDLMAKHLTRDYINVSKFNGGVVRAVAHAFRGAGFSNLAKVLEGATVVRGPPNMFKEFEKATGRKLLGVNDKRINAIALNLELCNTTFKIHATVGHETGALNKYPHEINSRLERVAIQKSTPEEIAQLKADIAGLTGNEEDDLGAAADTDATLYSFPGMLFDHQLYRSLWHMVRKIWVIMPFALLAMATTAFAGTTSGALANLTQGNFLNEVLYFVILPFGFGLGLMQAVTLFMKKEELPGKKEVNLKPLIIAIALSILFLPIHELGHMFAHKLFFTPGEGYMGMKTIFHWAYTPESAAVDKVSDFGQSLGLTFEDAANIRFGAGVGFSYLFALSFLLLYPLFKLFKQKAASIRKALKLFPVFIVLMNIRYIM